MDRLTTTTLLPGRPSHWAIIGLTIVLIVLLVLAMDVQASETPAIGDWEIDDAVVISSDYTVVTGNITVRDGGSLQLTSLSLEMNLSFPGQYHILVENGGQILLEDVTVDSLDRSSYFNFTISGDADIGNSTIRRMDGPITPNPLSNPQGLVIKSTSVSLRGSLISDCRGFAISVVPGGINDVRPSISGCAIVGNGGGIYCGGVLIAKGNARIESCSFSGNGLGDVVVVASDPVITDCSFNNNILSLGVTGITAIGLAAPMIEDCEFSWFLAAVISFFSDPVIRDCSISWSTAGITIVGDDPLIDNVTIANCLVPMNLTGTFATVTDCTISGFVPTEFSVMIDSGRPLIDRLVVDLTLFGGALFIINGSSAVVTDSLLSGSGALPVVAVEDSNPTLRGCEISGGSDGIELVDSPAIIEGCSILGNSGWGIVSMFDAFTSRDNTFGSGGDVNGEGRVLQLYYMEVWVEHEDGRPAVDATVALIDAMDGLWDEVATDVDGLAFEDVYPAYEITNANRTITYAPYTAEAFLGELFNITSFAIEGNPTIVLVLRPVIDLPPVVEILSPVHGGEYNVWEHDNRIHFEGFVMDPEDGEVTWEWYLDGEMVNDQELEFHLELAPGSIYQVALKGVDEAGQETWVYHNVSVVSIPPENNWVEIIAPRMDDVFEFGEELHLVCEYYVLDHPEMEAPRDLPVMWSSDLDGLLLEEREGIVGGLTPGVHIITVAVTPRFPEFIPEPYTALVTIEVLPPEPVAVAIISSPVDGATFEWDAIVTLSAEGSHFDIWGDLVYRTIYRWSSDLDGLLGEGETLEATHLTTGTHEIALLLTTDPFIVSAEAWVTINMQPEPNTVPNARISLLTTEPESGRPVLMTATLSADPDGDILSYKWDLGDGNISTLVDVNHTYEEPGNYTVRLTVFDGELEGTDQLIVQVAVGTDGGQNGGNGGNGGDGPGDDDPTVEPSDTWLGWIFIVLLFTAIGALMVLWYKGRSEQ
jgi:hypothetical protein